MAAEVNAENLREDERILQAIDKCINLRDHDYERNKGILKEILNDVFITIKGRDAFFREQFKGYFFVENYYKDSHVGKQTEFDVNIIIKMPLDFNYLTFVQGELGYRNLHVSQYPPQTPQWTKYSNFVSKWLVKIQSTSGYNSHYALDKEAFRRSMENLITWTMLNVPKIDNYTIQVYEGGSAFTLCVNKEDFPEMKVNLVPVLEFHCKPPDSVMKEGLAWYVVPDPLKNVKDQHLQWRMAFYNHEKDALERHSYLIPVIRNLTKLRDTQAWNFIEYHHITTLSMHYARSIENKSGLPDSSKLTGIKLFIHMLDKLRAMCKTQQLPSFWNSSHNLVNANLNQFVDITEKLTRMINEIIDDPAVMADWILTPEELKMFQTELKAMGILQDTDCHGENLNMSEHDEPVPSEDICNTADEASKPIVGANAASGGIESSPSTETGDEKAVRSEERDRDTLDLIDMLSRRLTALEQKPAATV